MQHLSIKTSALPEMAQNKDDEEIAVANISVTEKAIEQVPRKCVKEVLECVVLSFDVLCLDCAILYSVSLQFLLICGVKSVGTMSQVD